MLATQDTGIGLWGRIGTKLYLALGLAVLLTLLSSAVGVYYFEKSGNLSHRASQQVVPVLSGALRAEATALGIATWAIHPDTASGTPQLELLRESLSAPAGTPELKAASVDLYEDAANIVLKGETVVAPLSAIVKGLAAQRTDILSRVQALPVSEAGLPFLLDMLEAETVADAETAMSKFSIRASSGLISESVAKAASGDEGAFAILSIYWSQRERLDDARREIILEASQLVTQAQTLAESAQVLANANVNASVASFDQGRLLLFVICLISVITAIITSWLWVGNNILRRLSRLSRRMRSMAGGDLETPVPGVGGDEIGQLAGSLEVFRQQAFEVQRLNLVEELYGQLNTAYAELGAMQQRLVAQEKLAALGQLVSGVAHEISNPLNFVKNFAEGCKDLAEELFEVLKGHEDSLSEQDKETVMDLRGEIFDSLSRVLVNSSRALTVVQRMQSFGGSDTKPSTVKVNDAVNQATEGGLAFFSVEFPELTVTAEYSLSPDVGEVMAVVGDITESVFNLVTNSSYAMMVKKREDEEFVPRLLVTTRLSDYGSVIEILVEDNGTGITEEVQERMFNPFYTTRDGAFGAGLGLTLTADLARRGGGDMAYETVVGEGTTFTLMVPVKREGEGEDEEEMGMELAAGAVVAPLSDKMESLRGLGT